MDPKARKNTRQAPRSVRFAMLAVALSVFAAIWSTAYTLGAVSTFWPTVTALVGAAGSWSADRNR
ncbi:hypothetical protein WKI65_44045 [Streptomyces sp. MS1.AVA.3]|uniref:hypothetical protein n=1 Tax=Streptomyces decoyicus TaxID=249567 RepID=UPI0030BDF7FA